MLFTELIDFIPIITSGPIRYPKNITTIGANPITFPIIAFLEINLYVLLDSNLFQNPTHQMHL